MQRLRKEHDDEETDAVEDATLAEAYDFMIVQARKDLKELGL